MQGKNNGGTVMSPDDMVAFFNGEAEPHVRMEAAWTIIMASRAFDAPATDTVLIEHSGAGLEGPVAFLRTGLLLCYDAATDRWNLIAVDRWESPDGSLRAAYDATALQWHVSEMSSGG